MRKYGLHVTNHAIRRYMQRIEGVHVKHTEFISEEEYLRVVKCILQLFKISRPINAEQQALVASNPRRGLGFRADCNYYYNNCCVLVVKSGLIVTILTVDSHELLLREDPDVDSQKDDDTISDLEVPSQVKKNDSEYVDIKDLPEDIKNPNREIPFTFLAYACGADVDPALDYYLYNENVYGFSGINLLDAYELDSRSSSLLYHLKKMFNIKSTLIPLTICCEIAKALKITDLMRVRQLVRDILNDDKLLVTGDIKRYFPFPKNRLSRFMKNKRLFIEVIGNIVTFATAVNE